VSLLAAIAERVDEVVAAAWVDLRTGEVLERHAPRPELALALALDAAAEIMRSRERPPRVVLLSERHVHIVQRTARDPNRVLVVICDRSTNLGMAVAQVRSMVDAEVS
jgi:hypothetical protein